MISGKKNKTDTSWNSAHLSFTIQCCFFFVLTHYFTLTFSVLCSVLHISFYVLLKALLLLLLFLTASDSCSHLFLLLWASLLKHHTQTQHRSHPTALKLPVVRRMDESSFLLSTAQFSPGLANTFSNWVVGHRFETCFGLLPLAFFFSVFLTDRSVDDKGTRGFWVSKKKKEKKGGTEEAVRCNQTKSLCITQIPAACQKELARHQGECDYSALEKENQGWGGKTEWGDQTEWHLKGERRRKGSGVIEGGSDTNLIAVYKQVSGNYI